MTAIRVLYIDDEENNLNSFRATFRRQYEVHTAASGNDARNILATENIHVIISDQRMPEESGVQFFKSITEVYPDPVRILLTGYTDIEALTDAINLGHIYRYLTKPWNELELNNSILNAYEAYQNRVALKEKVEELQKANDQLNRFIYSISHELRAPLASALGVIELVKIENLLDDKSTTGEYWLMVKECLEKLDYNITKTLQYYRNSRYEIVNESINFEKLVHDLIGLHKMSNNIQNQNIFRVTIDQPVPFYGDTFRIETILGNLISNAIKYQRQEELEKKIEIEINVNSENMIAIVSDNGQGIAGNDVENVFTQFYRGKQSKGAGLGLFIAKEAVERINGKISVVPGESNGAIFTVVIPNIKSLNH